MYRQFAGKIHVKSAGSLKTASSKYAIDVQPTLGVNVGNNTASFNGAIRGLIGGAALANTNVAQSGIHGVYWITSTNASNWPKCAILGEVHDNTTTADGAFVALIGGDANVTTARAAYTVAWLNSAGTSKFTYGVDLGPPAISGYAAPKYGNADLRFANAAWFVSLSTAVTGNVTTTTAPSGSLGFTTHATGVGHLFYSDGAKWQQIA